MFEKWITSYLNDHWAQTYLSKQIDPETQVTANFNGVTVKNLQFNTEALSELLNLSSVHVSDMTIESVHSYIPFWNLLEESIQFKATKVRIALKRGIHPEIKEKLERLRRYSKPKQQKVSSLNNLNNLKYLIHRD